MKRFLLPCECAHAIIVTAGQAGGVVTCPSCAREVAVPKLREFSGLRLADANEPRPRHAWQVAHACMLAGGVTALVAWSAAAWFSVPPGASVTAATIRATIEAASDRQIYDAWKALSQSGIARPPLPDEKRIQQTANFRAGMARGLFVIGGLGAALGAVGAMLRSGRGKDGA